MKKKPAIPACLTADAALAQLRELRLQSVDWLRVLTCARVIAITAGLEPDMPDPAAHMTTLLDADFFDDLVTDIRNADAALPRLRALSLTSAGWVRVLLIAAVMEAVAAREAGR